ncbi:MAG: hypothetical protein ABEH43_06435, partial [Flavobacteriales bacterium]
MQYELNIEKPHLHFLQIKAEFNNINEKETTIQLPMWRPGRYQTTHFSKRIRKWSVRDKKGNELDYYKKGPETWVIDSKDTDAFEILYEYYADTLDAGSTYLDEEQLYVNPVNCLIYRPSNEEESADIKLNIPSNYIIATSLKEKQKHVLYAENVQELMDSPFIASPSLKHEQWKVSGVDFHLWFQGLCAPDFDKVKRDFEKYIKAQIQAFSEFPENEFHFLYQITPDSSYHGVEHERSTVIMLGPSYELMSDEGKYPAFLGVSSHELYHAWNIKKIRPK